MFFIVFHESKHGTDYTAHLTLPEAIQEANDLTKKHYSDYAKNYKEVKNEGCYDDIYIKELNISNEHISPKDINSIINLVVTNSHMLKTSDNEIDINQYPNLQLLLKNNNWTLSKGLSNYAKSYIVVDENEEPIRISTQYEKTNFKEIKELKIARNSSPDAHQRLIAKKIDHERDVQKDLKSMDEWISKWIDSGFKIQKYNNNEKENLTVLFL